MISNLRMQGLQDDLMRTATELDELCEALSGHALFLRDSVHKADAQAMGGHVEGLRDTACEMRHIANSIEA
ncbi:hypothetical protein [Pseudomonas entomophila]|uniref:hypothetical protein n=1 Tax=Pseudomonas entomophila TaxID=312306 RepID=UPI00200E895A|nr:hypothetical protein [Pseudomonas entomophila]